LDRRTKRSRGFGFVTFADPVSFFDTSSVLKKNLGPHVSHHVLQTLYSNLPYILLQTVAASLLKIIPGRTGVVNILGKNCELKASEPKSAQEMYEQSFMQQQYHHSQVPPPHHHQGVQYNGGGSSWQSSYSNGSTNTATANQTSQQRVVFGANGISSGVNDDPLQVPQTMPIPSNFKVTHTTASQGVGSQGGGSGVPTYSHSTITRTTTDEGMTNVYIQNNFYTLPPGTIPQAIGSVPSPEVLQAQQLEAVKTPGGLDSLTNPKVAPQYQSLQPAYPGRNGH